MRRTSVRLRSPVTQGSRSVTDAPGATFLPGKTTYSSSSWKLPIRLSPQSLGLLLILLFDLEIRTRDGKLLGRGHTARRKESQALIPESLALDIYIYFFSLPENMPVHAGEEVWGGFLKAVKHFSHVRSA